MRRSISNKRHPIWEFLNIEFDLNSRAFLLSAHCTQRPVYISMIKSAAHIFVRSKHSCLTCPMACLCLKVPWTAMPFDPLTTLQDTMRNSLLANRCLPLKCSKSRRPQGISGMRPRCHNRSCKPLVAVEQTSDTGSAMIEATFINPSSLQLIQFLSLRPRTNSWGEMLWM